MWQNVKIKKRSIKRRESYRFAVFHSIWTFISVKSSRRLECFLEVLIVNESSLSTILKTTVSL